MSDKQRFKSSVLKRVFGFTRPYRHQFYISVGMAILLAVLAPIRPWLIQIIVNKGVGEGTAGYFLATAGGFIIELTIVQIILLLIETGCRFLFSFLTASLGQSVVRDLRVSTYQKVLSLNLSRFDRTPIGTLTTRTISDIESVNDIFSDGLVPIIADLLSILSILVYMFLQDAKLTLVCLAPFPILLIATYFFKESVNRSFTKVRNAISSLNAFVQEHITGMSVVQAFAAERQEEEKFRKINKEYRDAHIKSILAYSIFFPVVELISALSVGLLVWWAALQAGTTAERASEAGGVITSFILCLNLLFRPLRLIADKFNVLQMGVIASERVFGVLDDKEVTADAGDYKPDAIRGDLSFQNVSFAYKDPLFVLKNISFEVKQGETLAIVGHTGSGKTSIISLINRLYTWQEGEIRVDGVEINKYDLAFLRSRIGIVLQDVFLFSGSIIDNVTLRNADISRARVIEAAKLIGLHDFIEQLPGGYDFEVMERGATLSMGQRQLLSFVRAVLYDPAILILDEATSSIDSESEALIQAAIDKLIAGRTSVVIAHRLSTIRKADKIMVLDAGEIKEFGTHAQLLAKQGYYYKLHQSQFENKSQ